MGGGLMMGVTPGIVLPGIVPRVASAAMVQVAPPVTIRRMKSFTLRRVSESTGSVTRITKCRRAEPHAGNTECIRAPGSCGGAKVANDVPIEPAVELTVIASRK